MSLLIFHYCICAFLSGSCSFNPSLCRLSPFLMPYVDVSRQCHLLNIPLQGLFNCGQIFCLCRDFHCVFQPPPRNYQPAATAEKKAKPPARPPPPPPRPVEKTVSYKTVIDRLNNWTILFGFSFSFSFLKKSNTSTYFYSMESLSQKSVAGLNYCLFSTRICVDFDWKYGYGYY